MTWRARTVSRPKQSASKDVSRCGPEDRWGERVKGQSLRGPADRCTIECQGSSGQRARGQALFGPADRYYAGGQVSEVSRCR
jgi:hypothetical protein